MDAAKSFDFRKPDSDFQKLLKRKQEIFKIKGEGKESKIF